jgi:hypothetical protein
MTKIERDEDIERRIQADAKALRAASAPGLPSLASALADLDEGADPARQRTTRKGGSMIARDTRKRWLRVATAGAVLTLAGGVFAATTTGLISVSVDTEGKTDEEVEDEIHDQLVQDGVVEPYVEFERADDGTSVDIEGEKEGKQLRIVQRRKGDGTGVVTIRPPALDTEREPGMTDEELRAKIQKQMDELGMGGEVVVEDGRVRIMARKRMEK